jgi:hypothetical protein
MVDNPQEQGITIAPLNVEVWVSIRMSKKEKAYYSLQLESHNSSGLCTKQFKVTKVVDLMQ